MNQCLEKDCPRNIPQVVMSIMGHADGPSDVPSDLSLSLPLAPSLVFAGFDTLFFVILGSLAYLQFRKSRDDLRQASGQAVAATVSAAGSDTRQLFLGMLSLSNFARAVSLCVEVFTQQDHQIQRSVRTWVRDFVMSMPTLFFLSTYSVVIVFWAQVYYASVLVSVPLLKPVVVFLNIAAYVLFAVIACLTLLLMAWTEFRQYLFFLLGSLFLVCSLYFFFFGIRVAAQLLDRNKQLSRKSRVIRRILVLTSTVPLVLLIKGVYCTAVGLGFLSLSAPWNLSRLTWDCVNFSVSELLPSLVMLCVFWPGRPRADAAYEPIASSLLSSDSLESPLISDRNPHLAEVQKRLESIRLAPGKGGESQATPASPLDEKHQQIEKLVSEPWKPRKSL